MKTAIILGATGMVGSALLKQLLDSPDYTSVIAFVRRASLAKHAKLTENVVDFNKPDSWAALVTGDILFSCLGTTLAVAGSKSNQFAVDYTYQYQMAKMAASNGVKSYVLVSSAGANANSGNFYLNMKGKLDAKVQKLDFQTINILRPGQLYGERNQKRNMEKMAISVMFFLNKMGLMRKYRPIHADEVAKAMLQVATSGKSTVYTLDELFF
ncbi:MAG: NAD(P)H-binding protein [Paludibacter sp.]